MKTITITAKHETSPLVELLKEFLVAAGLTENTIQAIKHIETDRLNPNQLNVTCYVQDRFGNFIPAPTGLEEVTFRLDLVNHTVDAV